ncbi:MAG: carboxymuconolactone decarboxylase family protein [Ignavibacteriales bacterium]|nr:carboxymuconolactone decarboxylase family protein [Ignavibacteriales bacterium]
MKDTYGKVFARPGLELAERELLNVIVLANQKLERQLYSHIRGALRCGLNPAQLLYALDLSEKITQTVHPSGAVIVRKLACR